MKRILCLILSFIMCFSIVIPVCAETTSLKYTLVPSDICNAIAYELSIFEQDKACIGMGNVDFHNLYISEKVGVYEYTQEGFHSLSTAYLLFEDGQVVNLAYQVDELQFQLMPSLASAIQQLDLTDCVLVYDANGCYIYNGFSLFPLGYAAETIEGRSFIQNATVAELSNLELCSLQSTQRLNYVSNSISARTQTNYTLSVSYITQLPYENLCWAACIAMISNYVNGTTLDTYTVASAFLGESNLDELVTIPQVRSIMNNTYNLGYSYVATVPSDNMLVSNIKNGYPIMGLTPTHAVTIYGVNVLAGRILLMDPLCGSITCYNSSSGYIYTHPTKGIQMIITDALCKKV